MPATPVYVGENLTCVAGNYLGRGEHHGRVEIALQRDIAQARPCLGKRNAPVYAKHIAACISHELEQRRRTGAEMNARDICSRKRVKDFFSVRENKCCVIRRSERADPTIKELNCLR